MIRGEADLRKAYRDDTVAREYIGERFTTPLGALLHERQVQTLVDVIEREHPRKVLEIAPGPARVTLDVARQCSVRGTVIDASLQMLGQARARLKSVTPPWHVVQGDAFSLPVSGPIDLVYSLRLIRHFEDRDRQRLYGQAFQVLKPGGILIFDAVNEVVSRALRASADRDEYRHYDALLRADTITAELNTAGFDVIELVGVQHRYRLLAWLQIAVAPRSNGLARFLMNRVDALGGEPLEWMVVCRRRA